MSTPLPDPDQAVSLHERSEPSRSPAPPAGRVLVEWGVGGIESTKSALNPPTSF